MNNSESIRDRIDNSLSLIEKLLMATIAIGILTVVLIISIVLMYC